MPGMSEQTTSPAPSGQSATAEQVNAEIRYTCWAVFRRGLQPSDDAGLALEACVAELAGRDVVVRGMYDVSAMRADADLMVWLHAPTAEAVQSGVRAVRRSGLADKAPLTWSGVGVHRPAEFNRGHIPAFLSGVPAQQWLVLYPFVRSYEWYLLPAAERRELLAEHGSMGREYPSVFGNTVASFALGDWEWLLGLESAQLHDIVDLMRHLRASGARRHVRAEIPFFTGRLISPAEAIEVLR